ncbi:MAG: GNAT family N-acetyltransferase [Xanthomonadaceae bacterium]|nr:GNAT family N-acetyltransferase [Xanthomonadaceae bacterium]MDE1960189.1 GNAT family N-acetyltransferase [Xanthomonadaceae bacterium]
MILSARLRLRALTTRDLALFRALYCDAETMRHIGKPLSRATAAASLRATVAAMRKPAGLRFFVIAECQSRLGVGLCSLRPAAWDKRGIELGIMLVHTARRHGYAREAFAALINYAFRALPIDTIWVQYRRANAGMARLCDILGFEGNFLPRSGTSVRRCVRIRRDRNGAVFSNQPTRGITMSNIIGFLEQAGSNAAMRHASREALLRTMQDKEIENVLRQPHRSLLDDLTGARETMYCKNTAIAPPKQKAPAKKKPAKKTPAKKPAKKAPAKRKR